MTRFLSNNMSRMRIKDGKTIIEDVQVMMHEGVGVFPSRKITEQVIGRERAHNGYIYPQIPRRETYLIVRKKNTPESRVDCSDPRNILQQEIAHQDILDIEVHGEDEIARNLANNLCTMLSHRESNDRNLEVFQNPYSMQTITHVAVDVHGTIIPTDVYGSELPPRQGLADFFKNMAKQNARVIATSSRSTSTMRANLEQCGVDCRRFYDFLQIEGIPKLYHRFLSHYNIQASQLLVIGDDQESDIKGAIKISARYIHVPAYRYKSDMDKFDFSKIIPD